VRRTFSIREMTSRQMTYTGAKAKKEAGIGKDYSGVR